MIQKITQRYDGLVMIPKPDAADLPAIGSLWDDPDSTPKGPDGLSLWVQTPVGPWHVDQEQPEDWKPIWGVWERTGTPPDIHKWQAIVIPEFKYHGMIRRGRLEHCLCRHEPLLWR